MQLLGASSTEDGLTAGLALIKNKVTKLNSSDETPLKIPHVGFNRVQQPKDSKLFNQVSVDAAFYFVHSYAMQTLDDSSKCATTLHGQKFVSAIESGQVFGTQFHPEKVKKMDSKFSRISYDNAHQTTDLYASLRQWLVYVVTKLSPAENWRYILARKELRFCKRRLFNRRTNRDRRKSTTPRHHKIL